MDSIIITTINSETEAIKKFKSIPGWKLILVGDKKTPSYSDPNINFMEFKSQLEKYDIANKISANSYCRKNIGYIEAIKNNSDVIYESDDDNIPYDSWDFEEFKSSSLLKCSNKFANIYKYLSGENIWARGFPLEYINSKIHYNLIESSCNIGVWQTLIDHDPDVDAIYRLTINKPIDFDVNNSFGIDVGVYAPFNSQSTFWTKECFPYLYFPCTVSWRLADILRSYITQRLLWHDGLKLGFRRSIVYQDRFRTDYMKDFIDEIPLYTNVIKIISILDSLTLTSNKFENMIIIYNELFKNGIVKKEELDILSVWIETLKG